MVNTVRPLIVDEVAAAKCGSDVLKRLVSFASHPERSEGSF